MQPLSKKNLKRTLLGPGPTNCAPSVLEVMSNPLVGHLDPVFGEIMDEISSGLRTLFQTKNEVCFAASATGTGGMETLTMNFIEPGDTIVVCVNGVFGARAKEMCTKLGANVIPLEVPYGEGITTDMLRSALETAGKVDAVWVVHAETSTGYIHKNIKELADLIHSFGGILFMDTVTGLGGNEVKIDEWGVDLAFSGTQKCLAVPPCLAPVTANARAIDKLHARKTPVPSFYFDLNKLLSYWEKKEGRRAYHHTAPITSAYALHEGIRLLLEEGLDKAQERHRQAGQALQEALESRGFVYAVKNPENRLPNLHCVYPPENVDEAKLRKLFLDKDIELGAGLGAFAGKAVRIGLMGPVNANMETVNMFLNVLDEVLPLAKK